MTATPLRRALPFALAVTLAAGLAGGCGLGEELERERRPDRESLPDPAPSPESELPPVPDGPPAPTAPTVPTGPGTPPAPAALPCPESGVRLTAGAVNPAMGLRALTVTLVNCGERPYALDGHPVVRVLDEDREPLDVEILRDPDAVTQFDDPGPVPMRLEPGESARTVLFWRNTVTAGTAEAGAALDIAPKAGTPAQELAVDGGIDLGTTGRLAASSWQPA